MLNMVHQQDVLGSATADKPDVGVKMGKPTFESTFKCVKSLQKAIFGNVVLCEHKYKKVKRAVKILDKDLVTRQQSAEKLPVFESALTEICVLRDMRVRHHPNVLCLAPEEEQFETERMLFVTTPYCEGGELFAKCSDGQISQDTALRIFAKIMEAVHHLHNCGYVHNDVSLENILLRYHDSNGERGERSLEPVLCDFGLCSKIGEISVKRGKVQYQAPEVIFGDVIALASNPKSDVYSLGVVLFIMIFKYPPYDCPLQKDARYAHIQAGKMKELLLLWNVAHLAPAHAIELLQSMLWENPEDRPSLETIMRSSIFAARDDESEESIDDVEMDLLFEEDDNHMHIEIEKDECSAPISHHTPRHKSSQPAIYSTSPDNVFGIGLMQNRLLHP